MNVGRFNTPVTVQRKGATVDTLGQPLETWVDAAFLWGHVRHLSGAEAIKSGGITSQVKASIRVAWCMGINAGMRVIADCEVYEIKAVLPDMQRRQFVDLVCEVIA